MNKATKALRRSSIRLKSIGSGHSDLNMIVSDLKDVRSTAKAFMEAQDTAWRDLIKWSSKEKNSAIHESFTHFIELSYLWTEVQTEFLEHLNKFRSNFDMILEGEVSIDKLRDRLASCELRESRLKKELQKATQKSSLEEVKQIEQKLVDAKSSIKAAQIEISERVNENENVKLIRLKEGLTKMSECYLDLTQKACIIFEGQKEIASGLPDVEERGMHDMKYRGSEMAKRTVLRVKDSVRSYKKPSQFSPAAPPACRFDFPPPYSSTPPQFSPHMYPQPQMNPHSPPQYQNMASMEHRYNEVCEEGATAAWPNRYSNLYMASYMHRYDLPPRENYEQDMCNAMGGARV